MVVFVIFHFWYAALSLRILSGYFKEYFLTKQYYNATVQCSGEESLNVLVGPLQGEFDLVKEIFCLCLSGK